MPVSRSSSDEVQPQAPLSKAPQRDIYDIVVRMVIGLVMNYVTRRLRRRQQEAKARKEAGRRIAKLAKKGKEIPPDLKKDSLAGLSRGKKKKLVKKGVKVASKKGKGKGKKAKKGKKGKLLWLAAIVVVIVVVVKSAGKK